MNKSDVEIQVQIEPGDYWLSDPCYVIDDSDWLPWLEACNFREEDNLVGKIPGTDLYAVGFRTAWGDGVYDLEKDGEVVAELGVDAGLIGFVPCEYGGKASLYVTKVTFTRTTSVFWKKGNIRWSQGGVDYQIKTDDDDGDW